MLRENQLCNSALHGSTNLLLQTRLPFLSRKNFNQENAQKILLSSTSRVNAEEWCNRISESCGSPLFAVAEWRVESCILYTFSLPTRDFS